MRIPEANFHCSEPELCLRDFIQEEKKSIIKEKPKLSSNKLLYLIKVGTSKGSLENSEDLSDK